MRHLALDNFTPPRILLRPVNRKCWKLGATFVAVCLQDTKNGGLPHIFNTPIVMAAVLLVLRVLNHLKGFNVLGREKALELGGALLDTGPNAIFGRYQGG